MAVHALDFCVQEAQRLVQEWGHADLGDAWGVPCH